MNKKLFYIVFISVLSLGKIFSQTYDISFTGVQWEDASGNLLNPNSLTGCKTVIYYAQLVQVAGGGFGPPSSDYYYFADGGAVITVTAVDATILSTPTGSFAGYFTWTLVNNVLTGVQNQDIPMTQDDDGLNGISGGRFVVPIETPNIQNQTYSVTASVSHNNSAVYNQSTQADMESANGQNNQDCILPITLVSFDAVAINNKSRLSWASNEEINASHFEIQRIDQFVSGNTRSEGLDEQFITKLGSVDVTGSRSSYSFVDDTPNSGANYYRLKLVDLDGSFTYSQVRVVDFKSVGNVSVFPNPFQDYFEIRLNNEYDNLVIYNTEGQIIKRTFVSGFNYVQVDLQSMNSGVYFAEVSKNDGSNTKRMKVIKIAK